MDATATADERRQSHRMDMIGWRATMAREDASVRSCEVLDVSEHGMFIVPDGRSHIEHGETLEVHGRYRGAQFICRGVVRWNGPSAHHDRAGVGIEFSRETSLHLRSLFR